MDMAPKLLVKPPKSRNQCHYRADKSRAVNHYSVVVLYGFFCFGQFVPEQLNLAGDFSNFAEDFRVVLPDVVHALRESAKFPIDVVQALPEMGRVIVSSWAIRSDN